MDQLNNHIIRFLLNTAIPCKKYKSNKENLKLYSAIRRAHRDVLAGRWYLKKYCSISDKIIEFLYSEIQTSNEMLNSSDLINSITREYPGVNFGAVQKLVNMTLKYIIILNAFDDDFNIAVDIKRCDCPLDSIILEKLGRSDVKWTSITSDKYKEMQELISNRLSNDKGNIYYDFENWE